MEEGFPYVSYLLEQIDIEGGISAPFQNFMQRVMVYYWRSESRIDDLCVGLSQYIHKANPPEVTYNPF